MVRLKYRYIIGQALVDPLWKENQSNGPLIATSDFQNMIRDKIQALFGDYGSGKFGLITYLKYFHHNSLIYVIRTPREYLNECLYALFCTTEIKKIQLTLRTLQVTSCVRTCKENLILYLIRSEKTSNSSTSSTIEEEKIIEDRIQLLVNDLEL